MTVDRAHDLDGTLAAYDHVAGLVAHIRHACGCDPAHALLGQVAIHGYHFVLTDDVFTVYILTDTGFVVAEMNTAGTTLSVFVPRSRLRRVSELHEGDRCVVSVEIDADVVRYTEQHEPSADGSVAIAGVRSCVRYDIVGALGDSDLAGLARQLRR